MLMLVPLVARGAPKPIGEFGKRAEPSAMVSSCASHSFGGERFSGHRFSCWGCQIPTDHPSPRSSPPNPAWASHGWSPGAGWSARFSEWYWAVCRCCFCQRLWSPMGQWLLCWGWSAALPAFTRAPTASGAIALTVVALGEARHSDDLVGLVCTVIIMVIGAMIALDHLRDLPWARCGRWQGPFRQCAVRSL